MMQTVDMPAIRVLAALVLSGLVLAACQGPTAPGTDEPAGSPIAPAVEQTHPGAERTLSLPSASPVAPAIEPEPTGPDPTVDLPDDVDLTRSATPVAPAIEPEHGEPDPTIELVPN